MFFVDLVQIFDLKQDFAPGCEDYYFFDVAQYIWRKFSLRSVASILQNATHLPTYSHWSPFIICLMNYHSFLSYYLLSLIDWFGFLLCCYFSHIENCAMTSLCMQMRRACWAVLIQVSISMYLCNFVLLSLTYTFGSTLSSFFQPIIGLVGLYSLEASHCQQSYSPTRSFYGPLQAVDSDSSISSSCSYSTF